MAAAAVLGPRAQPRPAAVKMAAYEKENAQKSAMYEKCHGHPPLPACLPQDLCRARMSKKAEAERIEARGAGEGAHVDARLASLSRESEGSNNSPSSRSSTSSWTEEPALTNMDISTGHMVLVSE